MSSSLSSSFTAYDYGSLMHYSSKAFSKNGYATIIATRAGGEAMGQRSDFSGKDIERINRMYCY